VVLHEIGYLADRAALEYGFVGLGAARGRRDERHDQPDAAYGVLGALAQREALRTGTGDPAPAAARGRAAPKRSRIGVAAQS
jgi:hypothetical protein